MSDLRRYRLPDELRTPTRRLVGKTALSSSVFVLALFLCLLCPNMWVRGGCYLVMTAAFFYIVESGGTLLESAIEYHEDHHVSWWQKRKIIKGFTALLKEEVEKDNV